MRVVFIADTHGKHDRVRVPEGDLLVHAGDFTVWGRLDELAPAARWFAAQPHRHKIAIAGNHDWCFEREPGASRALLEGATYLEDSACTVGGLLFYGSPWQPAFKHWAFNLPRGEALAERWSQIPADTDVLVTHGPPRGHGDRVVLGGRVGCADLLAAARRIRPRVHVFGHIHEAYGRSHEAGTEFVNASVCTFFYRPTNPPVVIDLEPPDAPEPRRWGPDP